MVNPPAYLLLNLLSSTLQDQRPDLLCLCLCSRSVARDPSKYNVSSLLYSSNQKQTGAIDDVHRAVGNCKDKEKEREGKGVIEVLAKLKYELQHDRQLTYAIDQANMFLSTKTELALWSTMGARMSRTTTLSFRP